MLRCLLPSPKRCDRHRKTMRHDHSFLWKISNKGHEMGQQKFEVESRWNWITKTFLHTLRRSIPCYFHQQLRTFSWKIECNFHGTIHSIYHSWRQIDIKFFVCNLGIDTLTVKKLNSCCSARNRNFFTCFNE